MLGKALCGFACATAASSALCLPIICEQVTHKAVDVCKERQRRKLIQLTAIDAQNYTIFGTLWLVDVIEKTAKRIQCTAVGG